jgi:hypothetical protein
MRFAIGFLVASAILGCRDSAPTSPDDSAQEMKNAFQLPRGIQVADLTGIREGYSVAASQDGYHVFTINVSAEKIHPVFCRLAALVDEPGFLLLEVGTHRDIEQTLRKSDTDPFHRDVYYLDDQRWTDVNPIVDTFSTLLAHDGGLNLGFGSHEGHDEVFVGPYKIFTIYADNPKKYEAVLDELGYAKAERIRTVWDNFTHDSPGSRNVLTDAQPTIWEMVEQLKPKELYFADRRED